jgi:hypothetical protein
VADRKRPRRRDDQGAIPPPFVGEFDIASWFTAREDDPWSIPVFGPYAIRDGNVVPFPGEPSTSFQPRSTPWLTSEFGHLAKDGSTQRILDFANRFGLPGQPGAAGMSVTTIRRTARRYRALLEAWFEVGGLADGVLSFNLGAEISNYDTLQFVFEALKSTPRPTKLEFGAEAPSSEVLNMFGSFEEPLLLEQVMSLQFYADVVTRRQAQHCSLGECGKVFVWPIGSSRSRTRPAGRPALYCSREHSFRASRLRRQKGDSDGLD